MIFITSAFLGILAMSRMLPYIVLIHLCILGQYASAQPIIQYAPQKGQVLFTGLKNLAQMPQDTQWKHYFTIYVGTPTTKKPSQPPVLGAYRIEKDTLFFIPRFPFVKGQIYTVQFHLQKYHHNFQKSIVPPTKIFEHTFTVAKPITAPTTHVSQIYPTSNTLPENLLKFYIYFSAPMQRDQTYSNIRLLDKSGKEISNPFLEVTPELWSPHTQRFTLFFDPGRIKRGLMPNQDLGLALKEGNTYHLVISSSLKDANNNRLTTPYTKTFTITTADRTSPNTKIWRISSPTKKTHEPVVLIFNEPLDHALLHRLIEVKNLKEQTLSGTIKITHNETQWHFTPKTPWASGPHTIHINPILEDLAGNQLTRLFDMDLDHQTAQITSSNPIVLPFQIR